jgi:hypothetical protein
MCTDDLDLIVEICFGVTLITVTIAFIALLFKIVKEN